MPFVTFKSSAGKHPEFPGNGPTPLSWFAGFRLRLSALADNDAVRLGMLVIVFKASLTVVVIAIGRGMSITS